MLSADLGPGLLGQIYDGLQNPLPVLAEQAGWFLERGIYADGLNTEKKWEFTPTAQVGNIVRAGEYIGTVPEGPFTHKIFVPFYLLGNYMVKSIAEKGEYTVKETIAVLTDERGREIPVSMSRASPAMPGSSSGRWKSRMWTPSRAFPRPFPSTRRPPVKTPAPLWAR